MVPISDLDFFGSFSDSTLNQHMFYDLRDEAIAIDIEVEDMVMVPDHNGSKLTALSP